MKQYKRSLAKAPQRVIADRGYKGRTHIESTIPKPFSKELNQNQKIKRRKAHRRRTAIEPVIGHLKSDHHLSRNFNKGDFEDTINIMLAAAFFNFKCMIDKYKQKIDRIILRVQSIFFY